MAPCCWSENLAMHRSEVAAEMRAEIGRRVREGQSDREILDAFIARYGQRILVVPEGKLGDILLWAPPVLFLLALVFVVRLVIVWRRRGVEMAAAEPDGTARTGNP